MSPSYDPEHVFLKQLIKIKAKGEESQPKSLQFVLTKTEGSTITRV